MHLLCTLWTNQKRYLYELMNFAVSQSCSFLGCTMKLFLPSKNWKNKTKQNNNGLVVSLFVDLYFKPAVYFKIVQCKLKQKKSYGSETWWNQVKHVRLAPSAPFDLASGLSLYEHPGVPDFCWAFFTSHIAFPNISWSQCWHSFLGMLHYPGSSGCETGSVGQYPCLSPFRMM